MTAIFDFREVQNIVPVKLENKEQLYFDLLNIEHSWTGRLDLMFANQFFQEAVQLIVNSIVLFERGYFDCAFYSLRQSLEISTTIVYFVDDDEKNRKQELNKWKKQERFPMQAQMIAELQKRKAVFADIKDKMSAYFEEIENSKQKLNKYVHKQGFDKFYVHLNHPFTIDKSKTGLIEDFNEFLIKTMGAIAVFRLAIDPLPLLLADEDIYNRTQQLMTEGYSKKFLEKYVGEANISAYKETKLYKEYYEELILREEMLPSVVNIVKDNFIDREKFAEITSQAHLLSIYDRVAVALFASSEKIVKVYCMGGFHWYFSTTESVKNDRHFSSADFNIFKNKDIKYNVPYGKAFLSFFNIWNEDFYIEHNLIFTPEELNGLDAIRTKFN